MNDSFSALFKILSSFYQIYLKNMEDFSGLNEVYDKWVEPGFEPARACVEAALAAPQILVEMVVTAVKKD